MQSVLRWVYVSDLVAPDTVSADDSVAAPETASVPPTPALPEAENVVHASPARPVVPVTDSVPPTFALPESDSDVQLTPASQSFAASPTKTPRSSPLRLQLQSSTPSSRSRSGPLPSMLLWQKCTLLLSYSFCSPIHFGSISSSSEDTCIYVDSETRIQILDTMLLLPQADREQCAAFIRDERVMVIWSESIDRIVPLCADFEERLIKLLWRSRPLAPPSVKSGGQASSSYNGHSDVTTAEGVAPPSEGFGLLAGRVQSPVNATLRSKGLFGELGRDPADDLPNEKEENLTQPKKPIVTKQQPKSRARRGKGHSSEEESDKSQTHSEESEDSDEVTRRRERASRKSKGGRRDEERSGKIESRRHKEQKGKDPEIVNEKKKGKTRKNRSESDNDEKEDRETRRDKVEKREIRRDVVGM